ncbi:MAG: hypothetical protein WCT77_04345 [Bacteroidota bacterium]
MKEEKNWNFEILSDKLGAYHKFYKITKSNSFLVLDIDGKYINGFSLSENFSLDSLNTALKQSKSSTVDNILNPFKTVIFKEEGKSLNTTDGLMGLFSEKNNKYYLMDISTCNFMVSDTSGIINQKINIKSKLQISGLSLMHFTWRAIDSIIVIQGYNSSITGFKNLIIEYNLNSDSLYFVNVGKNKTSEMDEVYGNPINYGYIGSIVPYNSKKEISELKSLLFYNSIGGLIQEDENLDEIYYKYNLKTTFRQILGFSENNLFSIQMFSNYIKKRDKDLKLNKKIEIKRSPNLRETIESVPIIRQKSDWSGFSNRNSFYQFLLVDSETNNMLLGFFNYCVPDSVYDLAHPVVKKKWFYSFFDEKGIGISEFLINDFNPWVINYQKNVIIYLTVKDNVAQAKWCLLPNNKK